MKGLDLLGLTEAEARAKLEGQPLRVRMYTTPRGEVAGPVLRVVRAYRQEGAWELVLCGFPAPLSEEDEA